MRTWELTLGLEDGPAEEPLFRRIARVVAHDIQRGRLKPGERIASTRVLAAQLGVNRNTVVAAFETLSRTGWIEGHTRSGSFVSTVLPTSQVDPRAAMAPPGFALGPESPGQRPVPRSPSMRLLLGGVPDVRLVPVRELARAYGAALRGLRGRRAIDYGDPQGSERLRLALAQFLARTRGMAVGPESIGIVRGSQQGLYLCSRVLFKPGDVVAVEQLGFPPGWEALRLAGAELVPLPVDQEGLDVAALEALCRVRPVRAVVLTPHHQYPTTVTLSPSRRRRLLTLAREERLVVLEDDYDFEFHYDGPPVLPLAASDRAGVVVYVGTLSKSLAPGLRLGYVVGHPDVVRRIISYRSWVDQQGDHVVEQAVAQLIEEGDLQRHTRRARRVYRNRRDVMAGLLREHLPDLMFTPPSGGMAFWARAPGTNTTVWAESALAAQVAFQPGARLDFHGVATEYLRVGFAACDEGELAEAVGRMAVVRPPRRAGRAPADDR